jgi:hypothetical protein
MENYYTLVSAFIIFASENQVGSLLFNTLTNCYDTN